MTIFEKLLKINFKMIRLCEENFIALTKKKENFIVKVYSRKFNIKIRWWNLYELVFKLHPFTWFLIKKTYIYFSFTPFKNLKLILPPFQLFVRFWLAREFKKVNKIFWTCGFKRKDMWTVPHYHLILWF